SQTLCRASSQLLSRFLESRHKPLHRGHSLVMPVQQAAQAHPQPVLVQAQPLAVQAHFPLLHQTSTLAQESVMLAHLKVQATVVTCSTQQTYAQAAVELISKT